VSPVLHVVMYHYVRDLPNTDFPRIKGMLTDDFRRQLAALQNCYEMATLESALDFLRGAYTPGRDLCLLTFDDGLKDHYADVTPLLVDHGVQGLFFVITSCLQDHRVVSVHMNHFLMAALDFEPYQQAFSQALRDIAPHMCPALDIDASVVQRTYRWDTPDVARFKYLFNFVLDQEVRDQVVKRLFEEHLGDEAAFSSTLYLSWEEARQMQAAGMLLGGHSHQHKPFAGLSDGESLWDLRTCRHLLEEHLQPQALWPFCYPYGKKDSFNDVTIQQLEQLRFVCGFSTEIGANRPGMEAFIIHRIDGKDAPRA
jgi:peptidoglycan/xylan/chitin deacetylase (PgdA/CDA1 family)